MKEIIQSKYARFLIAGLAFNILCAWFSKGFYHADEHFQILEFCNYKMGHLPASQLPWEFQEKMRASLLPYIAYVMVKVMVSCGLYNPFTLAFLLRLLAGIASWFIVCKFCLLLLPKFKSPVAEKLFVLMSMLLWFVPFLSVRFTAENISGILLLYGLYYILRSFEKSSLNLRTCVFAGFVFGVSFFIRFQIGFALVGLIAWLLFIKKISWKPVLALGISALAAIGLNILLDYMFYGQWVFTPYNYYYANVIQHKAADFGVSPWWFYFTEFIMKAAPPVSIVLLFMFFAGVLKNVKQNPFVWIIVPFLLLHFLSPHKELRFFFPVLFIFIYCVALGFDYFLQNEKYFKIHKYIYKGSLIICIPLLAYQTLIPAQVPVYYCRYLYDNVPENGSDMLVLSNDYDMTIYGLCEGIYKKPELKITKLDSLRQISDYMQKNRLKTAFFICRENIQLANSIPGYKADMAYCFFPAWILKFDINNWEERSSLWKIYRISPN